MSSRNDQDGIHGNRRADHGSTSRQSFHRYNNSGAQATSGRGWAAQQARPNLQKSVSMPAGPHVTPSAASSSVAATPAAITTATATPPWSLQASMSLSPAQPTPMTLSTSFRSSQAMGVPSSSTSSENVAAATSGKAYSLDSGDDRYGSLPKNPSAVSCGGGHHGDGGGGGAGTDHQEPASTERTALLGDRGRGHASAPSRQYRSSFSQPASLSSSPKLGRFHSARQPRSQDFSSVAGGLRHNALTINSPTASGSYGSLADDGDTEPAQQRLTRAESTLTSIARQRAGLRKKCQTCGGTGHLQKDSHNELVALVPYGDQRLKPNRTKCYVISAIVLTVIGIGVAVFFLYPRHVLTSTCARTTDIMPTSTSAMNVSLELHFNATNENFFRLKLVNMSVSMRQVDLALGTTTIHFNKDNMIQPEHTAMLKHKVKGTFTGDQGRHAVEQCRQNASQDFFLTLNIQLTTTYLGISNQQDITIPHFFSCLQNTTFESGRPVAMTSTAVAAGAPGAALPVSALRMVPAQADRTRLRMAHLSGQSLYENSCESRKLVPLNSTASSSRHADDIPVPTPA